MGDVTFTKPGYRMADSSAPYIMQSGDRLGKICDSIRKSGEWIF